MEEIKEIAMLRLQQKPKTNFVHLVRSVKYPFRRTLFLREIERFDTAVHTPVVASLQQSESVKCYTHRSNGRFRTPALQKRTSVWVTQINLKLVVEGFLVAVLPRASCGTYGLRCSKTEENHLHIFAGVFTHSI